jgi:NAD(P)-dependent dehydrogenase (short-subunit alcohol dehydrogenase family)
MCNNAGISTEVEKGLSLRIHDTPTENYDRTHAINQRAVWLGCKYAVMQMLEQEPREPNARGESTRGWIINTASMLGLIGLANGPCYVPTKHAVVGITRQVAIDYAKDRIHCNCLCPGFVKSAMIDSLIPTDEHEKGLGEWRLFGSFERRSLANGLHSGFASVGSAGKAGRCC